MDYITGKAISRRTVLRGAGAALALPFLDAMAPVRLFASSPAKPVHRFLAYYLPNGMAMEHWTPEGVGRDFQLSPILEPLAPFREQMLVMSGVDASWNRNHAGASGCFLTGTTRGAENNTETLAETSMDQLLAREFGKETQLASLEMALDKPANAGVCAVGLSCAYTHTISWRSPTQPLPMEYQPRAVFERLFGDTGSTERAAREARLYQQKSILDAVLGKLNHLKREIGGEDQIKVDEYTTAVRDVERRIGLAEEQIDVELPLMEQPQGIPNEIEDHLELMLDLQLLAYRADLTRVITFMVGKEQNARPYPQIGVPEAWHPLSHHRQDPERIALMSKINRHHTELFAKYVKKLSETPDGDGSLLDHMTILYGCGISNSQRHAGDNLPLVVMGGANGRIKGGRHVKYDDRPMHANLLATLMDKMDVPVDKVGGSNGRLPIETLSEV
ncbi:MAG: DUF1552 domain-containing protein [Dehalococcoidia bacterium]